MREFGRIFDQVDQDLGEPPLITQDYKVFVFLFNFSGVKKYGVLIMIVKKGLRV